jgi:hypothetical protein
VQVAAADRLGDRLPGPRHPRASQRRLHAAAELAHRKGLGDVVVRAHLEPDDLVDLIALRGQHDDRHLAARAHPPADLDPVQLGEHQVEHDEVEALFAESAQRLLAVVGRNHLISVSAQRIGEQCLHCPLVVDEQDPCRFLGHAKEVRRPD